MNPSPNRNQGSGKQPVRANRRSPQRREYHETVVSTPTARGDVPSRDHERRDKGTENYTNTTARGDMKRLVEEILEQKKLVPASEEPQQRKSPFAVEIMKKPLPKKFKMPQITTYSGKDDPYDHVQNYESLMMLHGWDDEIMCRAFSLTLTSHARTWFNNLPEASISSFEQLRTEFVKAFAINSRRKKDATYLLSIRQGSKETLRQYVDRFRNATLEIRDLPVEVAISAMLQGTRMTSLQESLSLDPPANLADLFIRANKYILHAEVMRTITGVDDRDQKRSEREAEEGSRRRRERARSPRPPPQFHHYARLE